MGKKWRKTSATKESKQFKKPQLDLWNDTYLMVPHTTSSLQNALTKLITEQWELKETLKEQHVEIELLTEDLNTSQFQIAR